MTDRMSHRYRKQDPQRLRAPTWKLSHHLLMLFFFLCTPGERQARQKLSEFQNKAKATPWFGKLFRLTLCSMKVVDNDDASHMLHFYILAQGRAGQDMAAFALGQTLSHF